jgi:HEAT repeat protein
VEDRRAPRLVRAARAHFRAVGRAEPALALGDGGDLEALRPLQGLKSGDPSPDVRQAAALALRKLQPR